jgi:probable HAF family extracellular repeat protein
MYKTESGEGHACLWSPTSDLQDLGTLGGSGSYATGINDSGQVVGNYQTISGPTHSFLWTPTGGMKDLDPQKSWSEAAGINNSGQITGRADFGINDVNAFLKNPGQDIENLGSFGWGSQAYGINDKGQVVGTSQFVPGYFGHAFIKTPGQPMQDLGALEGKPTFATAINTSGQVVGYSYDSYSYQRRAFTWTATDGMQDLDPGFLHYNGLAKGINNSGIIVGSWGNEGYFIKYPGEPMQDLRSLVINPPGMMIPTNDIICINDNCSILFIIDYQPYLLTPVP